MEVEYKYYPYLEICKDYSTDGEKSEIQTFFADQTIFVTGGTGFLGKLLIEKLLRTCYDLKKIYMLVRMKKGKTESERFKETFDLECFDVLKKRQPNFLEKVSLIYGDISMPNLGLSDETINILIEEVTSVFHVAATIRFDQHMRQAFKINVIAVEDLLTMAKRMKRLKDFVHVSTAYSNCPRGEISERFYPPIITAENLSNLLSSLDDETISEITPTLLKDWPNTYVYTKAIGESVVAKHGIGLPIAVIRPSIVCSTVREPFPGWVDNIYGINGVLLGAGLGIIRAVPANTENNVELVPVDLVINNMIAAAWHLSHLEKMPENEKEIPIYNYVCSTWLKFTVGEFMNTCYSYKYECASVRSLWYYCIFVVNNPVRYEIAVFFLHTIPAYIIDFILLCIGKKTIAVAGYRRIKKMLAVLDYFVRSNWTFDDKNVKHLYSLMSQKDKQMFDFELSKRDFNAYVKNGLLGGRLFIAKDPLHTLPEGRKRIIMLQIAHYLLCLFLLYFLFKVFTFIFSFML